MVMKLRECGVASQGTDWCRVARNPVPIVRAIWKFSEVLIFSKMIDKVIRIGIDTVYTCQCTVLISLFQANST